MDEIYNIFYFINKDSRLSDTEKDNLIDKQVRERGNTFDAPPGLSVDEYSTMFMNQFLKNRQDSRDQFNNFMIKVRIGESFQVGNLECVNRLKQIESLSEFDSWENPGLVEYFKQISNF
jgi:hypothetical protein